MIKTEIQVVYARDASEIYNRRSALGSYIHCFCEIFTKHGYDLKINGLPFYKNKLVNNDKAIVTSGGIVKIIPFFLRDFLKDVRLFFKQEKLFKEIRKQPDFDFIIEFYTYGSKISYKFFKNYNKPFILIYDAPVIEAHAYFAKGWLFFKRIVEKREKKCLFTAKAIVVYSNAVKEYLEKKYKHPLPIVIHQNVDYTRFDFIDSKPDLKIINIGFIGSFLKWHSVDNLLKAFTFLKDQGYCVNLYLVGVGEEFLRIKTLVNENKFKENIIITGFLDGSELYIYKQLIHIGVMPGSNWYGAPNKLFEYGASNMAVVAPDTPTIKELFNEEVLLFENGSENGLYDCLKYLCDHTDKIKELAEKLQLKVKKDYSEKITFGFYNELITKNIL
ncbi:MAG TPA: glycosyltransferase [Bacteroidia bacterium]|nr:glycosyltransferase [Bacteroidia bacterium]